MWNPSDITTKVKKVLCEMIPDVNASELSQKTSLISDLRVDSLKVAELSILLEETFHQPLFLPDWLTSEDPENLTLGSLVGFLEKTLNNDAHPTIHHP